MKKLSAEKVLYPAAKRGPMMFPMGTWDKDVNYTSTDLLTPIVEEDGQYYYMNVEGVSLAGTDPKLSAGNNGIWSIADKFKVIFTDVLFSAFAKLGAAIFDDNYMFSQYGLDANDKDSKDYTSFDGDPTAHIGNRFAPNFCINFLTGEIWAQKAHISGEINAETGNFHGALITSLKNLSECDAIKNGVLDYTLRNDLNIIDDVSKSGSNCIIRLPTDEKYVGRHVFIQDGCIPAFTRSTINPTTYIVTDSYIFADYGYSSSDMMDKQVKKQIGFTSGIVELVGMKHTDTIVDSNNNKTTQIITYWAVLAMNTLIKDL